MKEHGEKTLPSRNTIQLWPQNYEIKTREEWGEKKHGTAPQKVLRKENKGKRWTHATSGRDFIDREKNTEFWEKGRSR